MNPFDELPAEETPTERLARERYELITSYDYLEARGFIETPQPESPSPFPRPTRVMKSVDNGPDGDDPNPRPPVAAALRVPVEEPEDLPAKRISSAR